MPKKVTWLIVRWERGESYRTPNSANPMWETLTRDERHALRVTDPTAYAALWKDAYDNDAPKSHPRFCDAELRDGMWTWMRMCPKSQAEEYAQEVLRHLRSWDIDATYEIRTVTE